jgi:precorrin-2 methylase
MALNSGRTVAFITLRDPMFYSTFSYLLPFDRSLLRGPGRVVPA